MYFSNSALMRSSSSRILSTSGFGGGGFGASAAVEEDDGFASDGIATGDLSFSGTAVGDWLLSAAAAGEGDGDTKGALSIGGFGESLRGATDGAVGVSGVEEAPNLDAMSAAAPAAVGFTTGAGCSTAVGRSPPNVVPFGVESALASVRGADGLG